MNEDKNVVNMMKSNMGKLDSYIECTEVLLREFERKAISAEEFKKMTAEVGVKVNTYEPAEITRMIRMYYIYLVHQSVDEFCYTIKDFTKKYCKIPCEEKKDGESKLDYYYRNYVSKKNVNNEFKICKYYRLVRNGGMHSAPVTNEEKNLLDDIRKNCLYDENGKLKPGLERKKNLF